MNSRFWTGVTLGVVALLSILFGIWVAVDIQREGHVDQQIMLESDAMGTNDFNAVDYGAVGDEPSSLRLPGPVPVIGAWFPQEVEMRHPEGYRDFIDAAAEHSH